MTEQFETVNESVYKMNNNNREKEHILSGIFKNRGKTKKARSLFFSHGELISLRFAVEAFRPKIIILIKNMEHYFISNKRL